MAIAPFVDRKIDKIGTSLRSRGILPGETDPHSMASGDLFAQAQGVSIKSFKDSRCRLLPLVSSNGYSSDPLPGDRGLAADSIKFDYTHINHGLGQLTFGVTQEIITYTRVSNFSPRILPFEDIFALRNSQDAVAFLKDSGVTAYPQVMLNPNYKNPGMMNGVIEPLEVRGTLPGASVDSPFVARSIKSSLMPKDRIFQYVRSHTLNKDRTVAYIDSQDTRLATKKYRIGVPGISDFGIEAVSSFDDSQQKTKIKNNLSSQNESDFNDFLGVGIISKMSVNTAFNFEPNRSVSRGETGIRNAPSVDSLAFGGLIK